MVEPRDEDLELQLCRYLDGELSRRERLALEARLEGDEALQEDLRRYAALDDYLAEMGSGELDGVDYDRQRAEIIAAVERKALLTPPRRRPILLRPTFGLLAAAASILLVLAVTGIFFPPGQPAETTSAVLVEIPAPAPRLTGGAEISVRLSPAEAHELPLAPEPESLGTTPPGTVVVSFSAHKHPPSTSVESLVVY